MTAESALNQVLEETRAQTELVSQAYQGIVKAKAEAIAEMQSATAEMRGDVDGYIAGARAEQSHFRLTKNQALIPNADSSSPAHWVTGFIKSARIVETVKSGVEPQNRSEIAREFLSAINSDRQYFAGRFNIWEIEQRPHINNEAKTYAYGFYQYFRMAGNCTAGAIVKHVSGPVPYGWFYTGLGSGEAAKVCTFHITWGETGIRNQYSYCQGYVKNPTGDYETDTTKVLIALPAVVSGHVPVGTGWGQFPYVGATDNEGERVFD